ncbi:phosphatase PAP2 family protein [Pantoea sp. 1.19]|uniref:phosphatase PAP2 family protein n=1 Tax=Pantoea sp. 1.19 TaxID=1925589 RepID=UPI000948EA65|nr:phosphatase PAP2 family protein [Pantoea sp. 1.19]
MTRTRLPLILFCNALGLALFLSWYLPARHGFWFTIDSGIFFWFNHHIVTNKALLWLVAITNYRAFDSISLVAMGALYYSFWRKETPQGRRRMLVIGFVMLLTAVVLNQLAHLLPVSHPSPTLTFENVHRVADLTGIKAKDASANSFPGDHGMMLLIFACFMWRYFGGRAFAIALVIAVCFALPRVMIGAHWFTDIAVGSLSVVLIGNSWWLLTPASDRVIDGLNRALPGPYKPD